MYSSAYVWAKILGHLEATLGTVIVSNSFDDAEVVELNEEQLILYSPSEFRVEVIRRRYSKIIEDALKNIDETEYNTILSKLITQKKGATKEQVTRFCMQRGFEYSRINELLCYIDSETTADMD